MTSERQQRRSQRRSEFFGRRIRAARNDEDVAKAAWTVLLAYIPRLPSVKREQAWRRLATELSRQAESVTGRELHM